jgi:hypothetical protein
VLRLSASSLDTHRQLSFSLTHTRFLVMLSSVFLSTTCPSRSPSFAASSLSVPLTTCTSIISNRMLVLSFYLTTRIS